MASRSRLSNATPGPSTQTRPVAGKELPAYQPIQYAMNADAQRALAHLYQKHDFSKLHDDFKAAILTITDSVTDINERLTERRDRIERQKSRKRKIASQESGEEEQDIPEQSEELSKTLQAFAEKVEGMTKRMDEGVRKMIDGQQGLANTRESLTAVTDHARHTASTQATTQARRTQAEAEEQPNRDGDEEMDDNEERQDTEYPDITPTDPGGATQTVTGPSTFFKDKTDEWRMRYQDKSLVDRYGGQNDYKNFRGLLHDAQYPDESVPLPPPNAWFEDGGMARPGMTQQEQDDDEDIQIVRGSTSTKCAITLREFVEPLTSKKCAHTFEAQAIRQMISVSQSRIDGRPGPRGTTVGGRPAVRCPVASCQEMLEQADLYVDAPIVRRIRRLQQRDQELIAERQDHDATIIDDDEDDEGPDIDELERDEPIPSTKPVKSEAASGKMR